MPRKLLSVIVSSETGVIIRVMQTCESVLMCLFMCVGASTHVGVCIWIHVYHLYIFMFGVAILTSWLQSRHGWKFIKQYGVKNIQ
jgi:hypothetical protein